MSGANVFGARQKARIFQKGKPDYVGGITKKSVVRIDPAVGRSRKEVRIGLRIKAAQNVLEFGISGDGTPMDVTVDPTGTIAAELEQVAPAAPGGEKWVGYVARYDPGVHGKNNFKTTLRVSPFTLDPKGFQEVAVAFTYSPTSYKDGHYIVATSVLPGSAADPEPVPPEAPVGAAKKAKKATRRKVAKKRAGKKSRR